jgi:hypothetical protein
MRLAQEYWQTQSRRDASLAQMTVLVHLRTERMICSTHRWPRRSLAMNLRISKVMSPTAAFGECVQEADQRRNRTASVTKPELPSHER